MHLRSYTTNDRNLTTYNGYMFGVHELNCTDFLSTCVNNLGMEISSSEKQLKFNLETYVPLDKNYIYDSAYAFKLDSYYKLMGIFH